MEMWFSDEHTDHARLSLRVERQLFSAESELQRIDVLESTEFGKVLVVDGDLMLTEKDEFIYHEMITHVPMAVHPGVKKVLVIGGGDGGVVRELIKYETIETIDVVEIDPLLVEVCRKYIPEIACSLTDQRVAIYHEDGLRFIRSRTDEYDLIIIDSPNPFGPGEGLFTKEFYGNCYNALHEDGIMINQNESPFYAEEAYQCQRMHKRIVETFPICRVYQAHIPSYPSGHWLFGFASKRYHPLDDLNGVAWKLRGISTRYYAPRLHAGVFALPVYVEELLKDVEEKRN
nr:polyamine aminopropyltransferase [uncultured Sellimonas sp.]